MDEPEQTNLIDRAILGDADALQHLVVLNHSRLRLVVDRELESWLRPQTDVDDILQETYTAAFRSITGCKFEQPSHFYRWLERIALNALKNRERALRRQKRDVSREYRDSTDRQTSYPALLERLAGPTGSPSQHFAREEAIAAVLSSMARLTDEQQRVVRLRFLEELSVAAVADRLGKTEAAVHMLCLRALRALREHLGSVSAYLSRR